MQVATLFRESATLLGATSMMESPSSSSMSSPSSSSSSTSASNGSNVSNGGGCGTTSLPKIGMTNTTDIKIFSPPSHQIQQNGTSNSFPSISSPPLTSSSSSSSSLSVNHLNDSINSDFNVNTNESQQQYNHQYHYQQQQNYGQHQYDPLHHQQKQHLVSQTQAHHTAPNQQQHSQSSNAQQQQNRHQNITNMTCIEDLMVEDNPGYKILSPSLMTKHETQDDGYETSGCDILTPNSHSNLQVATPQQLQHQHIPPAPLENDPYNFVDDDHMLQDHQSNSNLIHPHQINQQQQQQQNDTAFHNLPPSNDISIFQPQNKLLMATSTTTEHVGGDSDLPPVRKRGRKKKLDKDIGDSEDIDRQLMATGKSGSVLLKSMPKERKKHDRFNGMSEEDVSKRTLPDHLANNLDIVIIGINPGLFAAYKGHHYAGPGNHFWKCLYLSGLTQEQMSAEDDFKLIDVGIGFTNMVQRATKGSADLTRKEIKEGCRILMEKLHMYRPKIAVFNGKLIFEVFSGKKDFNFGRQPDMIDGTNTYMWVMPSSSARCAQLPRAADKVPFYTALKKFRDYLNGIITELDETDVIFNDPKFKQCCELKEKHLLNESNESNSNVILNDVSELNTSTLIPSSQPPEQSQQTIHLSHQQSQNQHQNDSRFLGGDGLPTQDRKQEQDHQHHQLLMSSNTEDFSAHDMLSPSGSFNIHEQHQHHHIHQQPNHSHLGQQASIVHQHTQLPSHPSVYQFHSHHPMQSLTHPPHHLHHHLHHQLQLQQHQPTQQQHAIMNDNQSTGSNISNHFSPNHHQLLNFHHTPPPSLMHNTTSLLISSAEKKKRGRPKKNKLPGSENQQHHHHQQQMTIDNNNSCSSEGGGHSLYKVTKKHESTLGSGNTEYQLTDCGNLPMKKKRGRPKKNKNLTGRETPQLSSTITGNDSGVCQSSVDGNISNSQNVGNHTNVQLQQQHEQQQHHNQQQQLFHPNLHQQQQQNRLYNNNDNSNNMFLHHHQQHQLKTPPHNLGYINTNLNVGESSDGGDCMNNIRINSPIVQQSQYHQQHTNVQQQMQHTNHQNNDLQESEVKIQNHYGTMTTSIRTPQPLSQLPEQNNQSQQRQLRREDNSTEIKNERCEETPSSSPAQNTELTPNNANQLLPSTDNNRITTAPSSNFLISSQHNNPFLPPSVYSHHQSATDQDYNIQLNTQQSSPSIAGTEERSSSCSKTNSPLTHLKKSNVETREVETSSASNTHVALIKSTTTDVTTKSLSGLESLVDQIPNLNETESLSGLSGGGPTITLSSILPPISSSIVTNHRLNTTSLIDDYGSPSCLYSPGYNQYSSNYGTPQSSLIPSTISAPVSATIGALSSTPPITSSSSQSMVAPLPPPPPVNSSYFSVSNLTSSNYTNPNSTYHSNLMTPAVHHSMFMDPPHMPVPVNPLYHHHHHHHPYGQSYSTYAGPPTFHVPSPNYPYGFGQAGGYGPQPTAGSSIGPTPPAPIVPPPQPPPPHHNTYHSMFDRLKPSDLSFGGF